MDTMRAFAMGIANRGREQKVFDWDRAARRIKETGARSAEAGLAMDWDSTGGRILADGQPVIREQTYTYLASTWATPLLVLDGEEEQCYRMASDTPKWGASTYWPESALTILRGNSGSGDPSQGTDR